MNLPLLSKLTANYLEAADAADAAAGAEALADAEAEAAGAEALADVEGSVEWLAAKAETANRAVTSAAIRFFIFSLSIQHVKGPTILADY